MIPDDMKPKPPGTVAYYTFEPQVSKQDPTMLAIKDALYQYAFKDLPIFVYETTAERQDWAATFKPKISVVVHARVLYDDEGKEPFVVRVDITPDMAMCIFDGTEKASWALDYLVKEVRHAIEQRIGIWAEKNGWPTPKGFKQEKKEALKALCMADEYVFEQETMLGISVASAFIKPYVHDLSFSAYMAMFKKVVEETHVQHQSMMTVLASHVASTFAKVSGSIFVNEWHGKSFTTMSIPSGNGANTGALRNAVPGVKTKVPCPATDCVWNADIWGMVQHLNDLHRYSREWIAEWLDILDDQGIADLSVDFDASESKQVVSADFSPDGDVYVDAALYTDGTLKITDSYFLAPEHPDAIQSISPTPYGPPTNDMIQWQGSMSQGTAKLLYGGIPVVADPAIPPDLAVLTSIPNVNSAPNPIPEKKEHP